MERGGGGQTASGAQEVTQEFAGFLLHLLDAGEMRDGAQNLERLDQYMKLYKESPVYSIGISGASCIPME